MDLLSIDEAAARMGLHPAHVRRLVRVGELPGLKIGGRWLVTDDALRSRHRLKAQPGRPLSPAMAWAVLAAVEAGQRDKLGSAAGRSAGGRGEPAGADAPDRRRRYRIRQLLSDAPSAERWAAWLRRRALPRRVWVHQGVLDRLGQDLRVHAGGPVAAAVAADGVGGPLLFYVAETDADHVVRDYRAVDEPDGQVLMMVVPKAVADAFGPPGEPVGAVVGLVDMLSSADARERHVAAVRLAELVGPIRSDGRS